MYRLNKVVCLRFWLARVQSSLACVSIELKGISLGLFGWCNGGSYPTAPFWGCSQACVLAVHIPVCWLFTGLCVGCSQACVLAVHRPVCWLFTGLCVVGCSQACVLAVHRPVLAVHIPVCWLFTFLCVGCSQACVLAVHIPVCWLFTGLCVGCS